MKIAGTARRRADILSIRCTLRGDMAKVAIPAQSGFPGRMDRLWEDTCLELFLCAGGSEPYWEFNLSPAGHWNVYGFSSCRKGMREEPAFPSLPFAVAIEEGAVRFSIDLDLGNIIPAGHALEMGIAAVIRTTAGSRSYWALAHPGTRPDFHRRDTFTLGLSADAGSQRGMNQ